MDRRKLAPRAVEVLAHPRNQVAERRLQVDLRKLDLHAARAAHKIKNEISLLRATVPSTNNGHGLRKRSIQEFPHLQGAMFGHSGEVKRPVSRQVKNTIYRASVELVRPPSGLDPAEKDGVPAIQVDEDKQEEKENAERADDSDDTMSEDLPFVPFQQQITLPKFHLLINALMNKSRASGSCLHSALVPEKNARFKAIVRAALNQSRLEKAGQTTENTSEDTENDTTDCLTTETDEDLTEKNDELRYDVSYQRQNSASRVRNVTSGNQFSTKGVPKTQSSWAGEKRQTVRPEMGMSSRSKSAPNLKASSEILEANSKIYRKRVLTTTEFLSSLAPDTQPWRTQSAFAARRHPSGTFGSTSATVGTRATKSAGVSRSFGSYMYGEYYYPATATTRTGHPSERFPVYNAFQIKKAKSEVPKVPIWKRKSVRDNCPACRNKLRQERSVEMAKAFRNALEIPTDDNRVASAVPMVGSRAASAAPSVRHRAASAVSPAGYRSATAVSPGGLRGSSQMSPGSFRSASALPTRRDETTAAESGTVGVDGGPSVKNAGSPLPTDTKDNESHQPPDKPDPKVVKNDLLNPDRLQEIQKQLEKARQMRTANTMTAHNIAFYGLKA